MSGTTTTFSQTNQLASVTITPGAGIEIVGTAPGRGYVQATVGVDGHLRLLASDGTVEDLGRIAPTIARIAPAGSSQADAAPIVTSTSIVLPGVAGGGLILPSGGGRFELINRCGFDVPLYPNYGAAIEQGAMNLPVAVGNGETAIFFSPPDGLLWVVT